MLHIRFTGIIFGFLFVLHALKSRSLHAHQGIVSSNFSINLLKMILSNSSRLRLSVVSIVFAGGETIGERLVASEETFVSVQKVGFELIC